MLLCMTKKKKKMAKVSANRPLAQYEEPAVFVPLAPRVRGRKRPALTLTLDPVTVAWIDAQVLKWSGAENRGTIVDGAIEEVRRRESAERGRLGTLAGTAVPTPQAAPPVTWLTYQREVGETARGVRVLLEQNKWPFRRVRGGRALVFLERAAWLLSTPPRCAATVVQEFARDGSLDPQRWTCSRPMGHVRFDVKARRSHRGTEATTGEVREWSDDEDSTEITVQAAQLQSREESEADELFASLHARELPPKPPKP